MKIEVRHRCDDFKSYRAARVKSLFNAESGYAVDIDCELPIEDDEWRVGLVVGPSGSGKTSIGRRIFGPEAFYEPAGWPSDAPIVDAIAPDGDFDAVTAALGTVGLGDVPAWLRPYGVLSNGERFRADLARIVAEKPARVVVDEFTSVVDRQIAKIGAMAFAKAWRRTSGQAVLLSCHYDIAEWLEPDWILDTASMKFARGSLRRPPIEVEVVRTDWSYWPLFAPHHYLRAGPMPFSVCYVATVDGEPVAHLGMGSMNKAGKAEARGCRLVVMPEWQGAGVGLRLLNGVCEMYAQGGGHGKLAGRPLTTMFHTSHPGLCAALRRDRRWRQVSAVMHGGHGGRNGSTLKVKSCDAHGVVSLRDRGAFGGHFRAIQGFRYYGQAAVDAARAS